VSEPGRVARLRERSLYFASRAKAAGFDIGASEDTAVVPILVGDSALAIRLSARLLHQGVSAAPMVAPAVPEKLARLRFFITAEHSTADIDAAISALSTVMRTVGQPVHAPR